MDFGPIYSKARPHWWDRRYLLPMPINSHEAEPKAEPSKAEPVRSRIPHPRNDRCFCGSGRKFKHCHLRKQ